MLKNQIIYGKNTVIEAIKNNQSLKCVYLVTGENDDIYKMAMNKKIEVKRLTKDKLNDLCNTSNGKVCNHQGVLGEVFEYDYYELESLVNDKNDSLIVALDGLEDPHNLGAITRTCEISGCDGIIIPKNRTVSVTSSVAKVSTGAIEYVKIARVTNLRQALQTLKQKGYWIVGAEYTDNSQDIWNADYNMKICLVIGSEGKGISRLIREECDFLVKIPMWGKINSLNASVSAAIIIYEIRRQQRNK